ncbi:MAG TPA: hypothetical protein VJ767_03725 [Nitrososphaeraceae archaeon]|nr:hypothetical protein [Nitrososphaeraceae archaeon]
MRILLDANFIINLQYTNCDQVLITLAKKNSWDIYLPKIAEAEATQKNPLTKSILQNIKNGQIIRTHGNSNTINLFQKYHGNLGKGELESMAIAYDCPDKSTNPYVILSDDDKARKKAKNYGIKSQGILSIFILANHQGFLEKQKAIDYVKILIKNNFIPKPNAYLLYLNSLH